MAKKNVWNTVTPLSKTLALFLFVTMPFIGFFLGMQLQKELDQPFMRESTEPPKSIAPKGTMCTMEVRECPDGSYVGRSGPNCEFESCPAK